MEDQETHLEEHTSTLVEEAIVAELAETIELQAQKLKALEGDAEVLRRERTALTTELHMARAWIRELAAELQRSDPPQETDGTTLRGRIYGQT